MKSYAIAAAIAVAMASATGCAVVPVGTANRACELLKIASNEADMAPAWYSDAGQVLYRCGHQDAKAEGELRACYAEARSGYRSRKECEAME